MFQTVAVLPTNKLYSSKIIKASALLGDTKILLSNWDEAQPVPQNLARFKQENIFGKTSRSRVEDILRIFHQRYLTSENEISALVTLVKKKFSPEGLDRILYFHTAQSDLLLYDAVVEILLPLHQAGRTDISIEDLKKPIIRWVEAGKTSARWSDYTVTRVIRGLMATLRDFGILEGAVKKRIAPIYLPLEAFAYLAFYLKQSQPSGLKLIHHPDWQLFFFTPPMVERMFVEAHQYRLLEFHAAGSVIRIDFPTETIKEYAYVITERPA